MVEANCLSNSRANSYLQDYLYNSFWDTIQKWEFESLIPHKPFVKSLTTPILQLAHQVEQKTVNLWVGGSIPLLYLSD